MSRAGTLTVPTPEKLDCAAFSIGRRWLSHMFQKANASQRPLALALAHDVGTY